MERSTGVPAVQRAVSCERPAPRAAGAEVVTGEYLGPEVTACQFSLYPLGRADIDAPVQGAIRATASRHLEVRVGNLSTLVYGDEEDVFAGLRAAFAAAKEYGPAVMVATFASGMPSDELVGGIQESLGATPRPEDTKGDGGSQHE
jgi:uncharacterized protein YqgV (UPF0045/DUF77 family)